MPPDPLILGFDTSAAHVAAALLSGDTLLAASFEERAKGQDQVLFDVLDAVLIEGGPGWDNLTAIAVGIGPGNFTGIRLAVAAAKGLGLSLGVPVIGVSRFDALHFGQGRRGHAAVAAPRGAVYLQSGQAEPVLYATPADVSPAVELGERPCLVGDVDITWAEALNAQPTEPRYPLAEAITRVACADLPNARPGVFPKPLYIKAPDAAPPKHAAPTLV